MDEKNPRNLSLNFNKERKQIDARNLNLNFGTSSESKDVSAFFIAEISSPVFEVNADFLQTDDVIAHVAVEINQPVLELDVISTLLPPEYAEIYAERLKNNCVF